MKRNYTTGREYTGRNAAILDCFADNYFMTFVQGRDKGFHLEKDSEGIGLILIDRRTGEEGKSYFYKRGFTVFGLSNWTINGQPVPEPDSAPRPKKVKAEKPEVIPTAAKKDRATSKVFKEPDKTIHAAAEYVNTRKEFLFNTASFFTRENKVISVEIKDGTAIFYNFGNHGRDKVCMIKTSSPNWTGMVSPKDAKAIIKDIDNFNCGLLKNKRITFGSEIDSIDPVTLPEGASVPVSEIRKVIHAASTDKVKPAFNAIAIFPDAIAASDSHRLSYVELPTGVKDCAIVPLDFAKAATGSVTISDTACASVTEYGYIFMRLVDGQFPNWRHVIPAEYAKGEIVPPLDWKELKNISISPSFKTVITPDGTFVNDTDGSLRKIFDVTFPERFAVNADYMAQAVTKESTVFFSGAMNPIVIKTGDIMDVVMPIQIKEVNK